MTRFHGEQADKGFRLLHLHSQPLPELPVLTHVSEVVCSPMHVHDPHVHPVYEICYVLSGRGERWVGPTRTMVGPGDLYVVHPGELHGARADPADPYHYFAIGFDPAWEALRASRFVVASDVRLALAETTILEEEQRVLEQRVIHGGEGAEHIIRRILAELDRLDHHPRRRALTVIMVQALLVELLVFVSRCSIVQHDRADASFRLRQPVRVEFRDLMTWLESRLADPPSLADMARRAHLSPAHFAVAFKSEVGCTPLEHLTHLRVEEAARRLTTTHDSVTSIALDLGFSSSQYFSLVFRKQKGCTPRAWRMQSRSPTS